MSEPFKFKHANEIAGFFVLGAIALLVLGIVFTGKSQGWFEARFRLNVIFDTAEGAFGLQEGAPVLVRNTIAGRVGPIEPTDDGLIGTTFILKERFRPFITVDSIAKIKRKFGVAGDTYVDIEIGQGAMIEDDAFIECVKDEEILETAQRILGEVQEHMLPIFEQVEAIISSAASILDQLDSGDGLAGAAISDPELKDSVKTTIAQVQEITERVGGTASHFEGMVTNDLVRIMANVSKLSDQMVVFANDDLPVLSRETVQVQNEAAQTLMETRRLIRGVQSHWLFRRYVEDDALPAATVIAREVEQEHSTLQKVEMRRQRLDHARLADDAEGIQRYAFDMALWSMQAGRLDDAERYWAESRFADWTLGDERPAPESLLFKAELARRRGDLELAAKGLAEVLEMTRGRRLRDIHADARIVELRILLDKQDYQAFSVAFPMAERAVNRADTSAWRMAELEGAKARWLQVEENVKEAASAFVRQATWLGKVNDYQGMSSALSMAADAHVQYGNKESAAMLYVRASSSYLAGGHVDRANTLLEKAKQLPSLEPSPLLEARIRDLEKQLQK